MQKLNPMRNINMRNNNSASTQQTNLTALYEKESFFVKSEAAPD